MTTPALPTETRVVIGKLAKSIAELCSEELDTPAARQVFLDRLSGQLLPTIPEQPDQQYEPIARLGAEVFPFGRYSGRQFDDIPLDFLDWICRQQEELTKKLRAYLRHPQLKSRRGAEEIFLQGEIEL